MTFQEQLFSWQNLNQAYAKASRGKRGRGATAAFELYLMDNLLELQHELGEQTYQPGAYSSFFIHDPKKRLISAATGQPNTQNPCPFWQRIEAQRSGRGVFTPIAIRPFHNGYVPPWRYYIVVYSICVIW